MIISLYAAPLVFLFIYISFAVIKLRRKHLVGIGDGGHKDLARAMRVHANFAEYVPLTLLLIFMLESSGGASWLIHAFGGMLLIGRLLHAYGVSHTKENLKFRQGGMILTFLTLIFCAVALFLIKL